MTATQTPTAPVVKGVEVLIPAGELITDDAYTGYMPAPANLTITVDRISNAWNDEVPFSTRYTRIPGTIIWKDDAGFYRSAEVTSAMVAQNAELNFTGLV